MKLKYKIMLAIITVGIGICLMTYQSYALWVASYTGGENIVEVGCFSVEFEELSSSIELHNTYPVSDEKGLSATPYTFKITNTCTNDAAYNVTLNTLTTNTMQKNWLKYAIYKNTESKPTTGTNLGTISNFNTATEELQITNLDESIIIASGNLKQNESETYNFYLWMDEATGNEAMNTKFEGSINVISTATKTNNYQETILNGADPVLKDPLIAVTIDNDGTVKRADLENEWYNYENKEWANAIILKDESSITNYSVGSIIPEDAIESYFVWIPKYRYQLWDLGEYQDLTKIDESKVHEIPIIFGDYNTSDSKENECTTPMESGATGNCQVGDYMTHPAFLSIPSTGFWVGKFETGTILTSDYNVRNGEAIQIKPNVVSWRNIQVANAFYTSYDYKRNLDSHMMKNTEWGAVAYLQHSAYGSAISVRINNNSNFITGYAANNEPTCGWTGTNEECNRTCNDGTCNTAYPNSVLASTTNNITGIYDMGGNAFEYVMGVMMNQNGKLISGRNSIYNSGFNGIFSCPTCDNDKSGLTELTSGYNFPEKKYYDIYSYFTTDEQYQRRILGDATGETGPFDSITYLNQPRQVNSLHTNAAWFIYSDSPWFIRGSAFDDGLHAGVFAFGNAYGREEVGGSFRLVLTP